MDISSYIALKNAGVKYYDNNGKEESLLKVLSDNGVNYIRIRIWNDPYNKEAW
nr:glycosyl hydrolase 53 family protein [uncultured Anaerobutyricum sp.]